MKFESYLRQVGRNIRTVRTRTGLKQIDVHVGSGLTYRHYQNIEAGKVNITIETLFRLATFFSIRVEELVMEKALLEMLPGKPGKRT